MVEVEARASGSRDVFVFDGECWFCMNWLRRIRRWTGGARAEFRPFQLAHSDYPAIPRAEFERAFHWIPAEGPVLKGAEAIFALAAAGDRSWHPWAGRLADLLLAAYRRWPLFRAVTDRSYRWVAEHRPFASRLTRWSMGEFTRPTSFAVARVAFEKGLFLCFALAFASLLPQLRGLIGEQGILPVTEWMEPAASRMGGAFRAFVELPSIFWFVPANWVDRAISMVGVAGLGASLLGLAGAGIPSWAVLSAAWLSYASLVNAGRIFLAFQWDSLLLELGFWGIVLSLLPRRKTQGERLLPLLVGAVLFKLMFLSGWVKLASGDAGWSDLTALSHHFETQPLPNPLSPWMHRLPAVVLKLLTAATLATEWVAPFLLLFPRRIRFMGVAAMAGLQLLIALTGNYGYFNLLTLTACFVMIDDLTWREVLPRAWVRRLLPRPPYPPISVRIPTKRSRAVLPVLALPMILFPIFVSFGWIGRDPGGLAWRMDSLLGRWRVSQDYGLFAVMTTKREEIFFEVSEDERSWTELPFRWKPQDPSSSPREAWTHMPRLDWQLWFAAFGSYDQPGNRWVASFMSRILEGRPEVFDLLDVPADSPFRAQPPRYIRARIATYEFASRDERRESGLVWRRGPARDWSPVLSRMPRP